MKRAGCAGGITFASHSHVGSGGCHYQAPIPVSAVEFQSPGPGIKLLSQMLRGVAYPVGPFGFLFIQNDPLLPLSDGISARNPSEANCFCHHRQREVPIEDVIRSIFAR
jgi:hypothetical protein